jgi:hypothetical protein
VVWRESRDGNAEIYYKRRDPTALAGVSGRGEDLLSGLHPNLMILPNPVDAAAEIAFRLPSGAPATVAIYNISGRLVWEEDLGHVVKGEHSIRWEGTDRHGHLVAPGIYLAKITAGGRAASARIVVLR